MIEFVYCIVDQRDGNFKNIYFSENDEMAKRHFEALLLMPESQMSLFPADFYLTCLGSFDHVTGKFTNQENIKPICTGVELAMRLKQNISCLKDHIDIAIIIDYLQKLRRSGVLPDNVIHALAGEASHKELKSDPLSTPPAEPASHEQRKAEVLGLKYPDRSDSETCEEEKK